MSEDLIKSADLSASGLISLLLLKINKYRQTLCHCQDNHHIYYFQCKVLSRAIRIKC